MEAKLKAGYMNKERAAQLAEKEVIKKQEEVRCLYWRAVYVCNILQSIQYFNGSVPISLQ